MANYKEAIGLILKNEGGYVFDPQDSGGETFKGVSRNNFPNWEGWGIIDSLKKSVGFPKCLLDREDLTILVNDFYKTQFWDKVWGDKINDQEIANSIFDFGVNAGAGTSIKLAQEMCNVVNDGIIGPNTLKAINLISTEKFIPLFKIKRIKRYIDICERKPDNKKFFYGWIRRVIL